MARPRAKAKKEREFYILSIKWTRGDEAVWWCPNNSGYTIVLDRAGRYTESEVRAHRSYYDDGQSARAIPCDDADNLSLRVVLNDSKIRELCKGSHITD